MHIDTDLKATESPLDADFLDAYLADRGGGGLAGIGAAVLAASRKYRIHAGYIAAHAALESDWGRSKIAREKNNLFGWQAFDDSPYASARAFPDRASCIDFVMGRVDALYLQSNGKYFRKAACLGTRRANPPYGMNAHYATDPDWGDKIARIARAMESAWQKSAGAAGKPAAAVAIGEPAAVARSALPGPDVAGILARARSQIGRPIRYRLGAGGMRPGDASPGGHCDCSGFVCWCLGISRRTTHPLYRAFNGGWINTDAMVHDAGVATGYFRLLARPEPGCVLVYGRRPPARAVGHCGIVSAVDGDVRVIHCAGSHDRNLGYAVAETDDAAFRSDDCVAIAFG